MQRTSRFGGGRLAAVLAVAGALLLSATASAVAAPAGTIVALKVSGSRAPYFVFGARPGRTVTGTVTVLNIGPRRGGVTLYATDATTGETSGAVYRSPQEPRRDVGAWIRLARRRLTLGPRRRQRVAFRVRIPRGARGGQHLGGIVAVPDQPQAQLRRRRGKAAFGVNVREQAVIAVQTNLPGPRDKRLAITGIKPGAQAGAQTLLIGLASTGDDLTKGAGQITVFDSHGDSRLYRRFALDTFVPHTRIDYPVEVMGRALGPGHYRAKITINWAGRSQTRILPFTITARNLKQTYGSRAAAAPGAGNGTGGWPWIVGGAVAAAAVLALGYVLGMRAKHRPASP